jgi:CRP-like cAMP-binding protein
MERKRISAGGVVASAIIGLGPQAKDPVLGRQGIHLLAAVPLFSGLSKRHLRRLADRVKLTRYRDGRVIVESGQPGNAFYVIAEGHAKVFRGKIATGRPLARLGPGDFFGEIAILDGRPRSATVVADGPVMALRLSRSAFQQIVKREASVSLSIIAELAARTRRGAVPE